MFKNLRVKLANSYKSATIKFNALMTVVLLNADHVVDSLKDNLPMVAQYLTSKVLQVVAIFILIGNIILRFKTNKGLEDK